MKKILLFAFIGLSTLSAQSQNIDDALRYAQTDLSGTARFRAMSGAFGALGGDFSSLSINPAGSTVFANNQVGVTLSSFGAKNDASYFGSKTNENNTNFDLNQAGAVFVLENNDENSGWKKFAFAVNYENTKSLNNSLTTAGINSNSIANYFTSYANGVPLDIVNGTAYNFGDLFYNEQQAYLGYNAFIINESPSYSDANRSYVSLVPAGGNYYQVNSLATSGYSGKVSFNASAQYKDKWFFGINLNSHFTDYTQSSSFYESNSNNTSTTENLVKRVTFNNDLYTYGTGFSFQLGTIFKPTTTVRLGLAYESPTWFKFNEELTQDLIGVSGTVGTELAPDYGIDNPTTMIYEPYKLQTPGKWTGSVAYVFGKKGLISLDYAIKDYSKTQFKPNNDFSSDNAAMKNLLDITNEIRVGTEYKIQKLSLRAGYHFEQSPYKNAKTIGDLYGISGGLGYNFGNTKLDLAYGYSKRKYDYQFFSQGLTDYATINEIKNTVSMTLLFEL